MSVTTGDFQDVKSSTTSRWVVLSILLVVYMVNFMDRQLFAVLQEQIRADLNLSDWQLGLLGGTMFGLFYAFAGLPIAWFADRRNRVKIIASACAIWSFFTALSGTAMNFVTMMLARIGVASAEAGGVSPSYSLISDFFPRHQRALAIGLFSIGAPLGLMAGTLLGAIIAEAYSWRWTFVIIGLPGIILAVLLFMTVHEPVRGGNEFKKDVEAPPANALKTLFATPSLAFLIAGASCTSFAGYSLYQWLPSFLQRTQGMGLEAVGSQLAPVFMIGILGSILGGWLGDKWGKYNAGAYGYLPGIAQLIAAPLFFLALLAPTGSQTILLLIIPTVLSYIWVGPSLAAAQNLSDPTIRATVAALFAFFNNLIGLGLGPLLVGGLSSVLTPDMGEAEALRTALLISSSVYVLGAVLFILAGLNIRRDILRPYLGE